MKIKRFVSLILSFIMAVTAMAFTALPAFAADPYYGRAETAAGGSLFLYFGADSITVSGKDAKETMQSTTLNSVTFLRPDNLKTDSNNLAVLTLPSVDLNGKNFDKIDIWVATPNESSVVIKVGDTQAAAFSAVKSGSWTDFTKFTADLTTTAASGNVTVNIAAGKGAKQFCGNYCYVKIYNSGVNDDPVAPDYSDYVDENMEPYKNKNLPPEVRAADLVARMTLEEKVSQLGYNAPAISRLGVGKYRYWREALHGVARQEKATSFPSSLSMSNTWDMDLIKRAADITATEARAKTGTADNRFDLSYWSPTVNMARDPRWGRNEEGYGEDPFLTAECGVAFVEGMQGNDEKYLKTIATIKHFIANNCEVERRYGTSVMDEQTLRDYYARAFQDITEKADPGSVMSSYNATTVTRNGELMYDYIPSPANGYVLTELLRRTWGFNGYVVGDCGAVNLLNSTRAYKRTLFPEADTREKLDAIPQSATVPFAIRAGNDLDCGSGGDAYQAHAYQAVENGYMSEDEIDIAVYRMFLLRMKTGEFDSGAKYQDLMNNASLLETAENVAVAEEAAEKSWVLLKNDNTLPLDKSSVKKIALVGNMASEAYLGGYAGTPENTVSPYSGLVSYVKENNMNTEINYLGNAADDAELFNLKSLKLLDKDGKVKVTVDLSKAESVEGCEKSGSAVNKVTPMASFIVKNINFSGIATVTAELENVGQGLPSGAIKINYGNNNQVVSSIPFNGQSTTVSAPYTGADGAYDGTTDLYFNISMDSDFSIEKYKEQLDAADYIIAYGGTTTADSNESHDRSSIDMPAHQAHVSDVANAYPDKTIVVMQTAGQMNVSPFEKSSKAILWNCYNGQTQGTALAKILFGEVNPSGKLSTTWYDPEDLKNELSVSAGNENKKQDPTDAGITWIRNDYSIRQRDTLPEGLPADCKFKDKFVGRTYQYYSGTPVYPFGYGLSYTNFSYSTPRAAESTVDVNGKISVSVDVTNTGSVSGDEVVQVYVKSPNGDGVNLPLKQLKGFKRTGEIAPGAKAENVTIDINIKDLHFYDEATTSTYVPTGEYTIMVGGDSKTAENNTVKVNVTGTLNNELKNVAAVPTGISLIGTVNTDGSAAKAVKTINPRLTAVMTNEKAVDLNGENVAVTYTSSNNEVAVVEDGVVKANTKEGAALITASVTIDGVTKTASFPVVSTLKEDISDAQKAEYKKSLDDLYNSYDKNSYSEENWKIMTETYNTALKQIEEEFDKDVLKKNVEDALAKMKSIKVIPPDGTDYYEITKIEDTLYNEVEVTVKYNGDAYVPAGTLIATVIDDNGKILRTSKTELKDSGKYKINDTFANGEKIEIHIWNTFEKMIPYSQKVEHMYVEKERPSFIVYNLGDSRFDGWFDSLEGEALPAVDGLNGFGGFSTNNNVTDKSYTYTKLDGSTEVIPLTRGVQSNAGGMDKKCLYFMPFSGYSKCKVTVLVNLVGGEREQYIYQDGKQLAKVTNDGTATVKALTAEITDMTKPVYTWGGGANKGVYAVIVEYTK